MPDEQAISKLLGSDSGILGMVIAAVIGCITLIPGFVAFPLAASLLAAGAGYAQIAVFISTLVLAIIMERTTTKEGSEAVCEMAFQQTDEK